MPGSTFTRPLLTYDPSLERNEVLLGGNFVLKVHRIAAQVFALPNVWVDVPFDTVSADTTLDGFSVDAGGVLITTDFPGIVAVNGCVRPRWEGAGNPSVIVASRLMQSDDGGATWDEQRCLQAINSRTFNANELATFRYGGTIRTIAGTMFKLQVQVSDVGMVLRGWVGFDNPVAVSMEAHKIGETDLA